MKDDQEETELELADSFVAHNQDGTVDLDRKESNQDYKELEPDENAQLQDSDSCTMRKGELIEQQELKRKYIQEQVVSKTQQP